MLMLSENSMIGCMLQNMQMITMRFLAMELFFKKYCVVKKNEFQKRATSLRGDSALFVDNLSRNTKIENVQGCYLTNIKNVDSNFRQDI